MKSAEFKVQTATFETQQQELKKSQQHLRQLKEDNVRLTKENQILQVRLDNSRTQFTELVTTNEKLANDCARRVTELKEKEDEEEREKNRVKSGKEMTQVRRELEEMQILFIISPLRVFILL